MNFNELNEKFNKWNPMENDYKNTKFNHYVSGPGAELDAELQPGQQASQNSNINITDNTAGQPIPALVFKNLPVGMTTKAIHNICSRYGQVKSVRDSTKNDYFFVDLATVADLEAVYRALERNDYGFKILLGKNNRKCSDMERNKNNQHVPPVPPLNTGIDYQSRSYRTSTNQHPRPKVCVDTLPDTNVCNIGLPLNLLLDDAHSLERQGLFKMPGNKIFNYRNGRSYVDMPEKAKRFIDKKHEESSGAFVAGKYKHSPEQNVMPNNIRQCSKCFYACDTVCGRCSQYYCSTSCQLRDWPQHRYICGKPKHLQKTPPPKKGNLTVNEVHNIPKEINQVTNNKDTPKSIEERMKKINETNNLQQPFKNQNQNQTDQKSSSSSISSASYFKNPPATCEEIDKQNMPRSGNIVTITAILKNNLVFIRSKTYDGNLCYFNTIDTLQSIGTTLKPLKTVPKCGSVVIAKFQNQYNRALVLNSSNPENINVHFMDYGNVDYVKFEYLYEAPEEFVKKPRHAIPVFLKDVPDIYMTQEIRKFMFTYLNNINVEIRYKAEDFRKESGIFAVELIDESTQQNLNKMIVKLSTPVEPQTTNEICNRGYLERKLLPSGNNVELIVTDNSLMNSGCVSCTIKPYLIEIQKFQKELQTYAESIPNQPYTPRVEELCIARYKVDGLWYRGLCLEAVGDGHPSIHFIDYGNITIVPIEDIRRYPRQFTFPIYTVDCEIKGLPHECDDKIVAKLEQLIPNGKSINCENVIAFEKEHFYIISLPNIIRELISCGLLKSDTH